MNRKIWFWPIYILLLLGVTLAGTEFVSSFLVPSWPARDLRPISVGALGENVAAMFADFPPRLIPHYNAWGVRDRPRSIERPADVRYRSVLVGDSFLEGYYIPAPISELVEQRWASEGHADAEAINLGVAATGPRQYYYRIKRVALALKPDTIVVFVYAGNDFIQVRFDDFAMPALAEELPVPSILGTIAPRTDWLASVPARPLRARPKQQGGSRRKRAAGRMGRDANSRADRAGRPSLAAILLSEARRGDDPRDGPGARRRADAVGARPAQGRPSDRCRMAARGHDRLGNRHVADAQGCPLADRMIDPKVVDDTLSWLVAAEELAKAHGAKLFIALAPVGIGDPEYVAFWKPWPGNTSATRCRPTPVTNDWRRRCASAACRSSTCATPSMAFAAATD